MPDEVQVQGAEDQYVYSCWAAQHLGKECVLFGVKIDEQGKRWAIIGYVQEVPIEEVATWSRKAVEAAKAAASGAPSASGHSGG